MIESILSALLAMSGQQIALAGGAGALGFTVFGWLLGKASNTAPYKACRAFWGRLCYRAGAGASKLTTGRFGATLVEPLEEITSDFVVLGVDQFFAGARSDNLKKLDKQLDRLQSVGSETRAKAIAAKMLDAVTAKARSGPLTQEEQTIFNRAMSAANAMTATRLTENNEKGA